MRSCLDQGWVVSHGEYGPFVDSDCLGYAAFVGSKVLIRKQPRSIPKTSNRTVSSKESWGFTGGFDDR